jgi:NADP-dependent 3-hydroxy acid dehydrogenase YdfG
MAYSKGKLAVITGAGSGIGRALAVHLNRQGCALCLSDINPETLEATLGMLPRTEVPASSDVLDVADREAVHGWAGEVGVRHGHVDIVVNNAGVALVATVEESDYADLEWLMGINFWGVVHGTRAFLPLLRRAQQGHLVNISSVFGLIGVPTQSAYNAAKFAVRGYTEALRQEMAGSNVHVCCVHPGGIRTAIARNARGGLTGLTAEERGTEFEKLARTTPESAAAQIVRAIERRRERLLIGRDARYISLISRLFPAGYPRLLPKLGRPDHSLGR